VFKAPFSDFKTPASYSLCLTERIADHPHENSNSIGEYQGIGRI
ncbi:MAG: hypothetical protein ACI9FU_002196, partial [Granulosicoccus sp.]